MKRTIFAIVILSTLLGGLCFAQSEGDQAYIKAMQANSPQEKATLLKDYIAKYAGKGGQYDGFAYSFLFQALVQSGKTDAETLGYGEKALTFAGIEDGDKARILMTLASVYAKNTQTADKAKQYANQLIQFAGTAKGKEGANRGRLERPHRGRPLHHRPGRRKRQGLQDRGRIVPRGLQHPEGQEDPGRDQAAWEKPSTTPATMADAEKVYRVTYGALQDGESLTALSQALYKQGKQAEAMAMFKEAFGKKKTGEMAYNIGRHAGQRSQDQPGPERRSHQVPARRRRPGHQERQAGPAGHGHRPEPVLQPGQGMEQPGQGDPGKQQAHRGLGQDPQHQVSRTKARTI